MGAPLGSSLETQHTPTLNDISSHSIKITSRGIVFMPSGQQDSSMWLSRALCDPFPPAVFSSSQNPRGRGWFCGTSPVSSHLNLIISPWTRLRWGPGASEGLASLPSSHRPAGLRAKPSCSACCLLTGNCQEATLCFKSVANPKRLGVCAKEEFYFIIRAKI